MAKHPMEDALAKTEAYLKQRQAERRLAEAAPDLLLALKCLEQEISDYMRINKLGDPAKKHNIRLARAAIAQAEGQ